jgi:hypothetical protein
MVNGAIEVLNNQAIAGFDQRSIDHVWQYRLPFRTDVPQVIKEYRNPFLPDFPIDYSDNDPQIQVLRHHYLNEFDDHHIREVLKDYSSDSVIYEVLDDVPTTYRRKKGVKKMCRDILGKVKNIELQHIAVNRNHAQVIWKGETSSHTTIVGTDSFTFDENNQITTQTIVALTQ